jgi:SAM-dependent methyltransferase
MGDATVLSRMMRTTHQLFPTVPLLAVAKEISLEDVRLGLEKMPDRFYEHGNTVLVITNLSYANAPSLALADPSKGPINWQVVKLEGSSANEFGDQIEALEPALAHGWETTPSPRTGNPAYVRPSVLVVYRGDHEFVLDSVIPHEGAVPGDYDFVLASQPWRARTSAQFKAQKILAPLSRALNPGGRLLVVQSYGHDPGAEVVRRLWPGEEPFPVGRHALIHALNVELGAQADGYDMADPPNDGAVFRYEMHTLPSEISDRIGTSTLFAAWNAVIYVNQIEDERLDEVVSSGAYLEATQQALHEHGGLWFNDEAFVVTRRRG